MNEQLKLSRLQWDEVYSYLVARLGAPEGERGAFLQHFTSERPPSEYRVCQALGTGGKLRYDPTGYRIYVNTYPEEETTCALLLIKEANAKLLRLVRYYRTSQGVPGYDYRLKLGETTIAGDVWVHLKTGATLTILSRAGWGRVRVEHESGKIRAKGDHYLAGDYMPRIWRGTSL